MRRFGHFLAMFAFVYRFIPFWSEHRPNERLFMAHSLVCLLAHVPGNEGVSTVGGLECFINVGQVKLGGRAVQISRVLSAFLSVISVSS